MFTKRKKETNTTETIKVQGASQIRYEAEMKKAELLQKYMKKAPEPEPDYEDDYDEEYGAGGQAQYHPPAEPDYLGLNARAIGNVRFAEPGAAGRQSAAVPLPVSGTALITQLNTVYLFFHAICFWFGNFQSCLILW